jgi:hypothetical protein
MPACLRFSLRALHAAHAVELADVVLARQQREAGDQQDDGCGDLQRPFR